MKFFHRLFMFLHLYGNISCTEKTNVTYCTWNCTCLGNTVDCSQKGLSLVPEYLPAWTEVLDVSSNRIETINNLDKLQNLKELNLNGNPLVQQSFDFCENLSKLISLRLCNLSSSVDSVVSRANISCGIGQLYLSHNQLREISWSFLTAFPRISLLDLSHNNFSILENLTLPIMIHLHNLILDDNIVNFISEDFFDSIPNVEILKLNRNKIQFLKKGLFMGMKHLKILELEYNRLVMVEGLTFKGLGSLVSLNLKKNSISKLMDGSFWGLTSIQLLDLSANNISSIDNRWLYGLESLKQLFMAHNKIEAILDDAWKFSKNITDLNLRYNRLTNLSESSFKQLSLLRKLQLQHNNISFIHDSTFHHLTFLKTLDLGFNNLSWTSDGSGTHFDNLFSLTRLMLEHNNIRSLSRRLFRDLISLKHLNVAGKSLTAIQARAFENIQNPKYFNMDSRNLLCDCQLAWLLEWLQKNNFEVQATCGYPETLVGRQLLQLHRDELKCFSFSRPVITQEPHSINAALNGNITLTCEAASAGKSLLHIEWRKDNAALDNLKFKEISVKPVPQSSSGTTITQVVSQVILSPVVNSHAGMYQCIASNVIGSTYSVKALVTVNVFPTFVKTPELNIMARLGTTARFDCSAVGLPSPVITLQKDGGDDFPAARERRMHIYPSDERFFIVNVKPEDQGTYTCSATNTVGVISFNTTLQVLEPPKFIRRMKTNKTVMEGETIVLECQARGSPHPKVEWLKDSKPTVLTLRHFSTGESQFLIIVQTNRDDEGEYSCIISNTLGSEKQTVYLSVIAPLSEENDSIQQVKEDYNSTTAGIIVIAVVCCIVVTSLAWACIIYSRTRRHYTTCSFKDHQDTSSKNNHLIKKINADVCTDVSAVIFAKHCHTCMGCAASKNPQHCNSSCKRATSSICSSFGANKITSLQCLTVVPNQHTNVESMEKQSHLDHISSINKEIFGEDKNGCLKSLKYTNSNEECFHCSLTKTSEINNVLPIIKS